MQSAWVLHHVRLEDAVYSEDVKFIGVYATQASADAAVRRLIEQPGFRDWPDAFACEEYGLGEDHWKEGFVRDGG